jgi:predicted MFS family arabinose efflux permease
MLAVLTGDKNAVIDVNSRRCIVAIVYLAVVGPCVFILQPGFIQGLVEYLGMTEQQAGQIAAAEMFGLATTTVLLSLFAERVTWRNVLVLCAAICMFGNFASMGQSDPQTLGIIRFITGLGSGGLISLTFTMAGLTERTDRNFGFIVSWVLIYGAFGMLLMPSAYHLLGMNGVLAFFGLFCASAMYFIRFLPDSGAAHIDSGKEKAYKSAIKNISLVAILIYNVAVGIVWAYLFLVGLEAGMEEQAVANALVASQFLGIAGAFLAVVFESRFGRLLPLMVGIFGGAASIYVLVGQLESAGFWLAVCGFNFLWNLSMPYLLATLAEFDHRGRIVVHGVSMQFVGYAIGPYVAAQLLTRGGYDLVNTTGVVLFVISAIVILPGILVQRQAQSF